MAAVLLAATTALLLVEFDSPALGRTLLDRAGAAAGARLEAAEFRLSLLRGLALRNVRASGRFPGGGYELAMERLVFRHRLPPLLLGRLTVDEVRLDRPRLVLTEKRAAGPGPPTTGAPPVAPVPVRLHVSEVLLEDGAVELRAPGAAPVSVDGLSLRLRDISANPAGGSVLAALSARGELEIDQIVLPAATVRRVAGTLRLADGRLQTGDLRFETDEGPFKATWSADLRRLPFTYTLALDGVPLDLNAMARAAPGSGRLGPAHLRIEGGGAGPDPRDLAATGTIRLEKGTLPSTPALAALEKALGRTRLVGAPYTATETPFRIERGRVYFEGLRLDTEGAGLEAGGWAGLDGALDVHAAIRTPRANVHIPQVPDQALDALTDAEGWLRVPVRITGTREAPRVAPDVGALLTQAQRGAAGGASRTACGACSASGTDAPLPRAHLLEEVLQLPPHGGRRRRPVPPAVAGQHPLEREVQQALHRADLLGPRVPARAAGRVEALSALPAHEVVAGEEDEAAVQQHGAARRVAGDRDGQQVVGEPDRLVPRQRPFDVRGVRRDVPGVEDAVTSEVVVEPAMVGDVVAVAQEHQGGASQGLDGPEERRRRPRRVHEHVPGRPGDEVRRGPVGVLGREAAVVDVVGQGLGEGAPRPARRPGGGRSRWTTSGTPPGPSGPAARPAGSAAVDAPRRVPATPRRRRRRGPRTGTWRSRCRSRRRRTLPARSPGAGPRCGPSIATGGP